MNFLRNLALSLLSFLLFLSLSIFGLAFMLNKTLLDPDFVTAELNRLDTLSLTREFISLSLQFPPETPYLSEAIDETITDLEPWMREQLSTAIYSSYDYFLGKSQSLNLVISLEPMTESLRDNLWQAFQASPPPELQGFPPAAAELYFNQLYQQFAEDIPATFEFTESSLPPDVLATLEQVKQYVKYYQLLYQPLIGLMGLLVLGIILISRQVKDITRRLGVPCLTYGASWYIGVLTTRYYAEQPLPIPGLPAALQEWMPRFLYNIVAPLEMFSLGLLIGGVVLTVISFVYKPRQASPETMTTQSAPDHQ